MAQYTHSFILAIFISAIAQGSSQATCGLKGLPLDTSESNLYIIPPISDALEKDATTWEHEYEGEVSKTTVKVASDYQYMAAKLDGNKMTYRMFANSQTKDFVKITDRRMMTRYINVHCKDGTAITYYMGIPVQDITPPIFLQDEYTFNISSNWNPKRPISEGQFVIAGDEAYEIGKGILDLRFEASVDNVLNITSTKLWGVPDPDQDMFYYRLDLFIHENKAVAPGERLQVMISAKDQYNTELTKININVSEE